MKASSIVKSIAFGLFIGIAAIGLLPFLFVFFVSDAYGLIELKDWVGIPPFIMLPAQLRTDKNGREGERTTSKEEQQ